MAKWPYNTPQWRKLRAAKLLATSHCEPCAMRGRNVAGNIVDHNIAITNGGNPFPPLSGLTSMCQACHNRKTAALDMPGGSGLAIAGADAHGLPVDHGHPFYAEGYTPRRTKQNGGLDRPWAFARTKFGGRK